jgi:predicted Zn-dependent protease
MVKALLGSLRACGVAAIFLSLLFSSCQKPVDATLQEDISITELKSFLASSTGYSIDNIEYSQSRKIFMIDKDVEMTIEEAKDHLSASKNLESNSNPGGRIAQRMYVYKVAGSKANPINVYADVSLPASWLDALDKSIANWNATNSLLYLKRITSVTKKTPVQITVGTFYTENTATIANGSYPDALGNPGKKIIVNTWYNSQSTGIKQTTLAHELGHCFGFHHTNSTAGTLINGTPLDDPESVMNSTVIDWKGFSYYDLIAIQTVYPK